MKREVTCVGNKECWGRLVWATGNARGGSGVGNWGCRRRVKCPEKMPSRRPLHRRATGAVNSSSPFLSQGEIRLPLMSHRENKIVVTNLSTLLLPGPVL